MQGWHYRKGLIYYYYFLTFKAHLPRAIMGPIMALDLPNHHPLTKSSTKTSKKWPAAGN